MKRVVWMFALLASLGLCACGGSTGGDEGPSYSGVTAKAAVDDTNVVLFSVVTAEGMKYALNPDLNPFGFWFGGAARESALESYTYEFQGVGDCGGTIEGKVVDTYDDATRTHSQHLYVIADDYCNTFSDRRTAARPGGDGYYTDGDVWNGTWILDRSSMDGEESAKASYRAISILSQDGLEGEFYDGSASRVVTWTPGEPRALAAMDPGFTDTSAVNLLFRATEEGETTDYKANLDIAIDPVTGGYLATGRVYAGDEGYADVANFEGEEGPDFFGLQWYYDWDMNRYYDGPYGGSVTFNGTEGKLGFSSYYDGWDYLPRYDISLWDAEGSYFAFFGLYNEYWEPVNPD